MDELLTGSCIEFDHVVKNFPTVTALDDVSFKISCGDRYALLGPNGAGKSTTLKILVGLLKPTSGEAKIGGFDPTSTEAKRIFGYLPEDAYPYPTLTVRENIEYIAALRGIKDAYQRAGDLMSQLDLFEYEHSKVVTLSRGNRQKVSVALAIVHNPKIILLDEPLNYLDIPTQSAVIKLLEKLNASYFVSTHIMEIATRLTKNVIILSHGKITWQGSIKELQDLATVDERIEDVVERIMTRGVS